ncbi:MAG: Hpt domain-containing protein [Limnobacter sp.]|nr:Hpt domain-containing protein [Limnobacter sp.]
MSNETLFNVTEALKRLDQDKELLVMLMHVSSSELDNNLQALGTALSKGSWTELRAAAHRIKGTCGTLGFDSCYAKATFLEKFCSSGAAEKDPTQTVILTQELQQTLNDALKAGLAWAKTA